MTSNQSLDTGLRGGSNWPPVDPFDQSDQEVDPWIKIEHLGRYLFAAEFFAIQDATNLLDLGCGIGYGIRELARVRRSRIVGVDYDLEPSRRLLDASKSLKRRVKLRQMDFEACDIGDLQPGAFHGATCFEVLEHLLHPERLLEVARLLLQPDGLLLVSVPDASAESFDMARLPNNREHRRAYTFDDLEKLLNQTGFSVVHRLGQGEIGRIMARDRKIEDSILEVEHSERVAGLHDPSVVRKLAFLLGMPNPSDLSGSYSIVLIARNS